MKYWFTVPHPVDEYTCEISKFTNCIGTLIAPAPKRLYTYKYYIQQGTPNNKKLTALSFEQKNNISHWGT